jgi:hypothetical protein
VVLYDFAAEEEDEVAIVQGESLDVAYEVGGWLQVRQTQHQCVVCIACVLLIAEKQIPSDGHFKWCIVEAKADIVLCQRQLRRGSSLLTNVLWLLLLPCR